MHQQLRVGIGIHVVDLRQIATREVGLHPGAPFSRGCVVPPLRIGRILDETRGQEPDGLLQPGGLEHGLHGTRRIDDEVQRLPADVMGAANRLGSELWRCKAEQGVGSRALERDDLRIDGRIGRLVRGLGDNHLVRSGAQMVAQRLEIILPEVVVLVEHRDGGGRAVLEQVLRVPYGSGLLARQESDGPRRGCRVAPLQTGGGDEQLRHAPGLEVFHRRRVGGRSEGTEQQQHLVRFH